MLRSHLLTFTSHSFITIDGGLQISALPRTLQSFARPHSAAQSTHQSNLTHDPSGLSCGEAHSSFQPHGLSDLQCILIPRSNYPARRTPLRLSVCYFLPSIPCVPHYRVRDQPTPLRLSLFQLRSECPQRMSQYPILCVVSGYSCHWSSPEIE